MWSLSGLILNYWPKLLSQSIPDGLGVFFGKMVICVISLSFLLTLQLRLQSPRARRHDPCRWTAPADQWRAWFFTDASHSQPDCSWDDILGISTLCSPWSGNQELPCGEWPSGENRRLWHVQGHLQHRLLQGKNICLNVCFMKNSSLVLLFLIVNT